MVCLCLYCIVLYCIVLCGLKIVLENERKITQKEIRKKISLSEAKISQIISELVEEGKLKKIRQGRINILIITRAF